MQLQTNRAAARKADWPKGVAWVEIRELAARQTCRDSRPSCLPGYLLQKSNFMLAKAWKAFVRVYFTLVWRLRRRLASSANSVLSWMLLTVAYVARTPRSHSEKGDNTTAALDLKIPNLRISKTRVESDSQNLQQKLIDNSDEKHWFLDDFIFLTELNSFKYVYPERNYSGTPKSTLSV